MLESIIYISICNFIYKNKCQNKIVIEINQLSVIILALQQLRTLYCVKMGPKFLILGSIMLYYHSILTRHSSSVCWKRESESHKWFWRAVSKVYTYRRFKFLFDKSARVDSSSSASEFVRKITILMPVGAPIILTEDFRSSLRSLQVNVGIIT